MVTVASSTRMPTASARPPRVIRFSVWPMADSMTMENRTASGMEVMTTMVLRQLPRNTSTSNAVNPAAINPSVTTARMALTTNTD